MCAAPVKDQTKDVRRSSAVASDEALYKVENLTRSRLLVLLHSFRLRGMLTD